MSEEEPKVSTKVTKVSKMADRAGGRQACLVVIYGLDLGKKFDLQQSTLIIGRSTKADLQIDQDAVSRHHAKIVNTGQNFQLHDLGSTNGTYVNDELVDEYVLRDGDFIKIGRTIFKFLSGANIENAYHEEIYRLTTIDGLTQVFNRRYLEEALEREIGRAQRYQRPLSAIMLDIDHFQELNETHGFLAGDYVLKQLASFLKARARREDIVARYGGEEFVILLPEVELAAATGSAEKLRHAVEERKLAFEDTELPVTISLGVATLPADGAEPAAFLRLLEECLHRAKREGRNRVVDTGTRKHLTQRQTPRPSPIDPATRTDLRLRRVPMVAFQRALETKPPRFVLALQLDEREQLALRHSPAVVDDLDEIVDRAVLSAMGDRDLTSRGEEGGVVFLALAGKPPPEELAAAVLARFEKDRAESTLPAARLTIGRAIAPAAGADAAQLGAQALAALEAERAARAAVDALPLPIAFAARLLATQADPVGQAMALVRLHETTVRWLMSWLVAELRAGEPLPELGEALARPVALGGWLKLLERAVARLRELPAGRLVFGEAFAGLFGPGGKESPVLTPLRGFVKSRNDWVHRPGAGDAHAAKARQLVERWRPELEAVLVALEPLKVMTPIVVRDMDFAPGPGPARFRYTVRALVGDNVVVPQRSLVSTRPLQRGQVHLHDERADRGLPLEPLVVYEECAACGTPDLFLVEQLHDRRPVYKSLRNDHELDGKDVAEIARRGETLAVFLG